MFRTGMCRREIIYGVLIKLPYFEVNNSIITVETHDCYELHVFNPSFIYLPLLCFIRVFCLTFMTCSFLSLQVSSFFCLSSGFAVETVFFCASSFPFSFSSYSSLALSHRHHRTTLKLIYRGTSSASNY